MMPTAKHKKSTSITDIQGERAIFYIKAIDDKEVFLKMEMMALFLTVNRFRPWLASTEALSLAAPRCPAAISSGHLPGRGTTMLARFLLFLLLANVLPRYLPAQSVKMGPRTQSTPGHTARH